MHQHPQEVWSGNTATLGTPELVTMARSMLAARRALIGPLPAELIPDPALDILLSLFVSYGGSGKVSTDELTMNLTVAPSVGERWITVLRQYGLVAEIGNHVELTLRGIKSVTASLKAVADSQWDLDA